MVAAQVEQGLRPEIQQADATHGPRALCPASTVFIFVIITMHDAIIIIKCQMSTLEPDLA